MWVLRCVEGKEVAMGHNPCLHFGADEHPCATYFDAHQWYRLLTHSQVSVIRLVL